jgi:hypothetical protein
MDLSKAHHHDKLNIGAQRRNFVIGGNPGLIGLRVRD